MATEVGDTKRFRKGSGSFRDKTDTEGTGAGLPHPLAKDWIPGEPSRGGRQARAYPIGDGLLMEGHLSAYCSTWTVGTHQLSSGRFGASFLHSRVISSPGTTHQSLG